MSDARVEINRRISESRLDELWRLTKEAEPGMAAVFPDTLRDLIRDIRDLAEAARLPRSGDGASGEGRAAQDVLAERRRQVEVEGWSAEHDDDHSRGQLAVAAACYCSIASNDDAMREARLHAGWRPATWPWNRDWWKPKDRRRDLVRAGALILAEIERLDRKAPPPGSDASPAEGREDA